MFNDSDLMGALTTCFVPALRRDVVAAGLVRSVAVLADRDAPGTGIAGVPDRYIARVTITAPGGDEAINAQTHAAVENFLLGMPEISRVEVTLVPALFPILSGR